MSTARTDGHCRAQVALVRGVEIVGRDSRTSSRVARHAGIVALFVVAALLGILSGVLFAYAGDLPQISALDNYSPEHHHPRLRAQTARSIGEFATQRRVVVGYDDIAPLLRQAIIADRRRGLRPALRPQHLAHARRGCCTDIVERRPRAGRQHAHAAARAQPVASSSASRQREVVRAQDQGDRLVAIQIEKRYTKQEIFTIYCNQMYLGHGAYGVEAASRLYFDKSNKQLTLEEAALIAGIFQTPERQSPFVDMKRATAAAQRRAAAHGRRALHHAGAGRRGQAEADRHARPAERSRPASRRSSSKKSASTSSASTAPRRCTRTASR